MRHTIGKFFRGMDGEGDAPIMDTNGTVVGFLNRRTEGMAGTTTGFRVCSYEVAWMDDSAVEFSVAEHGSAVAAKSAARKWINEREAAR